MADLRLVIFDMDGTLVDSLAHIRKAMENAFSENNLAPPTEDETRSIIGLSLPVAMARLRPTLSNREVDGLVEAYKGSFLRIRETSDKAQSSPLFSGALEAIADLNTDDHTLLGIATGKSRRGLSHVLGLHDLAHHFVTTQVADDHPSKPHPSMIEACLSEAGVSAEQAVIVGDTTFDLEMGRAAGVGTIGVSWGYHPTGSLMPFADQVIETFSQLGDAVDVLTGRGA